MRIFRRNRKGFTLIEVLVVIAIIGILGGIVAVSTVAVLKNSEKKSATTTLINYWNLTAQAFNQINLGFTMTDRPTSAFIATRLGKDSNMVTCVTSECTTLTTDGKVHIQYTDNKSSRNSRYQIKRIAMKYNGKLYYTDDGKTVKGPRDTFE